MTGDREYSEREWLEGLRPEDRDPGPKQHAATVRESHADAMTALAADVHPYSPEAIRQHEAALDAALDELVALASDHAADEREYEKQREYADEQYRKALAAEARADELQRKLDEAAENLGDLVQFGDATARARHAEARADELEGDRDDADYAAKLEREASALLRKRAEAAEARADELQRERDEAREMLKSIRTEPLNHAAEGDERIRTAVPSLGTDSAYEHQTPSYAQLADWWLCGQLLADPKDLLRGLLDEHKALLARAEADRG